jgi:hypothetical protein
MSWTEKMVEALVAESRSATGGHKRRLMDAATKLLDRSRWRGDDIRWPAEVAEYNFEGP